VHVNHICDDLSQCIIDCNAWQADFGLHKHKAKHTASSLWKLAGLDVAWGAMKGIFESFPW